MMNTKKIFELYIQDYEDIVKNGRFTGLDENKIEKLQESYLETVLFLLVKASGMPPQIKRVILQNVVQKIEKEA